MPLSRIQGCWLRLCTVVAVALAGSGSCSGRPLRLPLSTAAISSVTTAAGWAASITAPTTELLVPVSDASGMLLQGPCHNFKSELIKYPFSVMVQRNSGGSSSSSDGPAVTARTTTAVELQDKKLTNEQRPALQPCKVELESRDQQQQSQQHTVDRNQQLLAEKQQLNYTAYFRPLSKYICGKTPKAILTATIKLEGQPEQIISREMDVALWGCAFLTGDASAEPQSVPAGLPQQQMRPASASSKWPPAESPTLMR